mmetsp:Transcript_104713/g.312783  ORF Transcript_104713/g.312783 Transcript_104713/m.312783 type:complete len:215 (-) Transcript_104713:677-1321(-)
MTPGAGASSKKSDTYSSAKLSEGRCSRSMYSSSYSAKMERMALRTSASWNPKRFTRSISSRMAFSAGRILPGRGAMVMLIVFSGGTGSPVSVPTAKKFLGPFGSSMSLSRRELRALWKSSSVRRRRRPETLFGPSRGRLQSTMPCAKLSSRSVLLATVTPSESGTACLGRSGACGARGSGEISPGGMSKSSWIVFTTAGPSKSPTATTAILAGW